MQYTVKPAEDNMVQLHYLKIGQEFRHFSYQTSN